MPELIFNPLSHRHVLLYIPDANITGGSDLIELFYDRGEFNCRNVYQEFVVETSLRLETSFDARLIHDISDGIVEMRCMANGRKAWIPVRLISNIQLVKCFGYQ
jgi:hypothetical protein